MSLNLLPWREHRQHQVRHWAHLAAGIVLLIVAINIGVTLYHWQQRESEAQAQINQLQHSLQKLVVSDTKQRYQRLRQEINFSSTRRNYRKYKRINSRMATWSFIQKRYSKSKTLS